MCQVSYVLRCMCEHPAGISDRNFGISDRKMTIDHVIPKKHKGPTTGGNFVAARAICNARKGSRQPEQAGLARIRPPRRPNNVTFIRNHVGVSDQLGKPYLFLD